MPRRVRRRGARQWRFGYLDAQTGKETDGPALGPITAMGVRALGWRHGTDLVVLAYRPAADARKGADDPWWNDTDYWQTGGVTLVALRPGGGAEVLLEPPPEVVALDVAPDLLQAGAFGGPAPGPAAFPPRPLIMMMYLPAGFLLGAGVLLVVVWRIRRTPGLRASRVGRA